jgi:hypothetical protein
MKSLKEMEGTVIKAMLPGISTTKVSEVKLHRVEEFGIWVESQSLTDALLKALGTGLSEQTPVLLIPWHGVTIIFAETEGASIVSFSDK